MLLYNKHLFEGKNILVTGGGSGIGLKASELFLQCGANIFICGRSEEKLIKAKQDLDKFGNCQYFTCDIRESDQINQLSTFITEKVGKLDVLVNNAGGQFPSMAEDISEKGWKAVINNNLNGTWLMTQLMAKTFFIPQKYGTIVNVTVNTQRGVPGMVHTGAARAGIQNFSKSLAVEWAHYNIRINCIAPGIIQSTGLENYPLEMTIGLSSKIPMKKLGTTTDVANSILFLSSDLASYITGETLYVDGGSRLWGDFWEIS
jgi:citronellol/citronellal dehydrogenase